jgi:hypothetical protein
MGAHPQLDNSIIQRHAVAALNHYSVKSLEEFERKKLRGRGAKPDEPYGAGGKFKRYDTNFESNQDIDRKYPAMLSQLRKYKKDPVLAYLHQISCHRHFPESVFLTQ